MVILQQPDSVSLAGNIKDFIINSDSDTRFTLSVDGEICVDEMYTPVGGKITIAVKNLVNRYLRLFIPDYGQQVTDQAEAIKMFTASIGTDVINFTVIKGGIDGNIDCVSFLARNFLTWQEQQKSILLRQPEWLTYYAHAACKLVIKAYFTDRPSSTHEIALPAGKVSTVNTSYDIVNNLFPSVVSYYDIWVEGSGSRLTYIQRYVPIPEQDNSDIYIFENSLGGLDSFVCTGKLTEKISTEGTLTTQSEVTTDSSDLSISFEQKGFFRSRDEAKWLRDFFVSEQRYRITEDGLRKIYIADQENKFTISELNSFNFEFYYCDQTVYNKVIRNRDSLPELLEFPSPDDLFFLTPRLSEYPVTDYAEDLMLPVQHPYSGKWMHILISALKSGVGLIRTLGELENVTVEADKVSDTDRILVQSAGSEFWQTKLLSDVTNIDLEALKKQFAALGKDMKNGQAIVWDDVLKVIKTVAQVPDAILWNKQEFSSWLDQPVRTTDDVQFRDVLMRSFKTHNFAAGPLGAGVGMVNDDEFQTDKLLVRKIMYVLEMMVQRMKFQMGQLAITPGGGFKILKVETYDTYYRLFFNNDGGNVPNTFEPNDFGRIQNFTGNDQKYFWGLVLSVGPDYIDLSRVEKDGDGIPADGDEVVHLGNKNNPDRQDALLLTAVNGEVGMVTYFGINTFSLAGKEGSWFGRHGGKKGSVIRGEVHITSGSDGLDQFTEYEEVDNRLISAQEKADSAYQLSSEVSGRIDNVLTSLIPDLQTQIDGSIMSWEGTVAPTLTNEPAVNWTTESEKSRHIGDYYDYFLTVSGEQTTERYKFSKLNNVYTWVRVADSGSALALSEARAALGLAGSKSSIAVGSRPSPPYDIDDLWIDTSKKIYCCRVKREEGTTGLASDWELVNDAQVRLSNMASDGIISREEKPSYRNTLAQIEKEYSTYNAIQTSVSKTALTTAYNNVRNYFTGTLKVNENSDTSLTESQRNQFNTYLAAWYSSITDFTNLIAAEKAQSAVDGLEIGGQNLLDDTDRIYPNSREYTGIKVPVKIFEVGKTYTYSFDLKIEGTFPPPNTLVYNQIWGGIAQQGIFITYPRPTQEWKRFSVTFQWKAPVAENPGTLLEIGTYCVYDSGSIPRVRHPKIELGQKATDWTPSLNDTKKLISDAQDAADNANAAITVMNDDSVFDIKEKQSIRTQWENINGVANTTGTGTSGSYYKTKSLGAGLSQLSALTTAYTNLRTYLNGLALYTDSNIGNFSRATMAQKFTAYYDAEIALNNAIADKIAGDKVADIQIGGRNLISNSDFSTTDISMYSKSANSIYTITRENGMLKIVGSKTSNGNGEDNIIYVNTLKPNEDGDYTISFDGYALAPTTWYYRFGFFGAAENMARIEVGTTKKRYSATFKGGRYNDTYSTSVMWFNTATTLYIDNIKLEKGNKATAWSPAIEDVQKAVEAADTKAAQAKADAKTANDTLNSWKADGVISPLEKQAIKETQAAVLAEKNEIVAEAAKYNVSSTAYVTAWTNYNTQLSNHSKASPENITIAAALATTQTAYSSAKVAIRQAIADAARTYAGKVANDAVAGLKIGTRNLLWYSGRLIQNNDYNSAVYDATIDLVTGKKYTFALRGTTTGGQKMGLWMNGGSGGQRGFLKTNQADEVSFFTFTAIAPLSEVYKRRLHIYNYPSSGSAANPATIKWAALYEGEVKPPEDWSPAPEEVEESIQLAQTSADAANAKLADIASDNKLTAQEKQATQKEWDIIVSEKANVTAQGTAYGVSTTAYTNAYNALNTYITPLLANLTTTSDIVGTTFRTNFKNYYDARTALLKAVLDKAKQLTTNAQNAADAAKRAADAAQSTADTAKTNAQAANTALADWASDSKISPAEKTLLKQQKADISAEYNEISSQVTRYALTADASWTNYRTAYNNAIAAFNKYTAASPQFINVGSDYNNIAAYYTKRQTVLDNIALKAKQYADSVGNVVETRVNAKIDTKADRVELSSLQNNFNSLGNRVSKTEGSISTIQGRVDVLSTNVNSISGQITSLGVKLDSVSGQLNLFARKDDLFTGITLKPELIKVTGQTVFIDSAGNEVAMFKAGKVINVNNGVCSVDNAGKLIAKNAEISGKITASEGQFGNLKIMGSDEITFTSTDGCIRFASPDAGYTKINKTGTNVEIANWEGNCLSLAGYSSNGIALSILQQKGGKAIDTHGNLQFTLRQSEKLDIISNNSGKGVVNIDAAICFNPVVISNSITLGSPGTSTSVGFLVLCTNTSAITVYLPSSPFSGQTIYIRRCRAKVTIHGNGINIFRTNSAQSSWDLTNEGHMGRLVYYSGRWYANYLDI